MKAIIETGGKQYTVKVGDEIYVEKLDVEEGKTVKFTNVLMLGDVIGHPYVEGAVVTAKVVKQGKQRKIRIFKYIQKNNFRKRQGHRQPYTKVVIESIK